MRSDIQGSRQQIRPTPTGAQVDNMNIECTTIYQQMELLISLTTLVNDSSSHQRTPATEPLINQYVQQRIR